MEGNGWYVLRLYVRLTSDLCPNYVGKYVGNRPVKLKKADNSIRPVEIGHKKAKTLEKELKKNRHKPY